VEFRLLGPLEVLRDGERVELGGPRERAVLAALLFRANNVASVGYLVESVWDRVPVSPESNVRTYVVGLRRRLGTSRLVTRDGGYLLSVVPGELDVATFDEQISRAEEALADGDPDAAADGFRRALTCGGVSRWRASVLDRCCGWR
jgi:DNA-binding SARP family transcriptional activator